MASLSLFTLLPTEIRLEIWRYSCPERVVELTYDPEQDRCNSATLLPSVLHTCQESRFEALRIYKKMFNTKSHEGIYFCPSLDTLYLPRPPQMGYDNSSREFANLVSGALQVLNLALDHVKPAVRRPWEVYNKYVLMQSFPLVKEVVLVLDSEADHGPEGMVHGFIKLAEPCCDQAAVCQLLADVKESFSYELGTDFDPTDCEGEGYQRPPEIVLKSMIAEDFLRLL